MHSALTHPAECHYFMTKYLQLLLSGNFRAKLWVIIGYKLTLSGLAQEKRVKAHFSLILGEYLL